MLVRVVTEDLTVVERLVHFHLLDGPMNTIAPEVFDALRQITGLENRVRLRQQVADSHFGIRTYQVRTWYLPGSI